MTILIIIVPIRLLYFVLSIVASPIFVGFKKNLQQVRDAKILSHNKAAGQAPPLVKSAIYVNDNFTITKWNG